MSGDAPSRDQLIAGYQTMRTIREFTAPHAPTPFSPVLEDAYAPSAAQIASAVLATQSTARETEPAS